MQIPVTIISAASLAPDGWQSAGEGWTYVSADGPTGAFTVPSDVTAKYSPGMRIRLVQTTPKYFIITAVSTFSGGVTTITVYGGTDYTLANAAISSNYYSVAKAPFGFPLNPLKWTVELRDTTSPTQASPVQNTWYNLGSLSIDIPIGSWRVSYQVLTYYVEPGATFCQIMTTLSTANNSESDPDLSTSQYASSIAELQAMSTKWKYLLLAAKTTYFLNAKLATSAVPTNIYFQGAQIPTLVRAECAYL